MFRRLSNSLTSPKLVAGYYHEPFWKTFLFFLLLIFFIMIPTVLNLTTAQFFSAEAKKEFKKDFVSEEIPFIIENGELSNINNESDFVYNKKLTETLTLVITEDINNVHTTLNGMSIVFTKDKVYLSVSTVHQELLSYNDYSYLTNLDLSNKDLYSDINFWDNIFSIVDSYINSIRPAYILMYSLFYIVYWSGILLLFILIISFFSKMRVGHYLKFWDIMKLSVYNLMPFIICTVFANLFGIRFLMYVGYLVSAGFNIVTINEVLLNLHFRREGE